jgi:WhiB family transcriptional regulator, redox-sensing transcriptional regulator
VPVPQPANGMLLRRRDWLAHGACRDEDPDLFFPITSKGPAARQILAAKAVCARCPVRSDCLDSALEDSYSYGVWGGTTEEERKAMRRARTRARRSLTRVTAVAS